MTLQARRLLSEGATACTGRGRRRDVKLSCFLAALSWSIGVFICNIYSMRMGKEIETIDLKSLQLL
jgi:hypothetical protein